MTITASEVRQIIREELAAALHPSIRVDARGAITELVGRVAQDARASDQRNSTKASV